MDGTDVGEIVNIVAHRTYVLKETEEMASMNTLDERYHG